MIKVSVIIPTYNYGVFVGKAIQSVLDQTFEDVEVIVVDDGSTDNTADSVAVFSDARVRYIYQENRGLPGARNTGIRASTGQYLAFLDADDQYHPEKLARHVSILDTYPVVGLTYCDRLYVDGEGKAFRWRRSPRMVTLSDLVTYYPFSPSDVVMRREWAFNVGLFDESFVANSEDLNFHLRLMLDGCLFGRAPGALGYRQLLAERKFRNIEHKVETFLRALDTAFDDPRCPAEVLELRERSYADHYLSWGVQAAVQGETDLGRRFIGEALALQPSLLANGAAAARSHLVHAASREGGDAGERIPSMIAALPDELRSLREQAPAMIGAAYLRSGLCDLIWDRPERGCERLAKARENQAVIDADLRTFVVHQLAGHVIVYGEEATQNVCTVLNDELCQLGYRQASQRIMGDFQVNEAFRYFDAENYRKAKSRAAAAVRYNPAYLRDRGVWSVTLRSLWKEVKS